MNSKYEGLEHLLAQEAANASLSQEERYMQELYAQEIGYSSHGGEPPAEYQNIAPQQYASYPQPQAQYQQYQQQYAGQQSQPDPNFPQDPNKKIDFSSSAFKEEVRRRAQMNPNQPQLLSQPAFSGHAEEDKALRKKQFKFDTPTAQNFTWKTDNSHQESVHIFANILGMALDAFNQGNFPACQAYLRQATNLGMGLRKSDQQVAKTRLENVRKYMAQANPGAFSMIENQDLQSGQPQPEGLGQLVPAGPPPIPEWKKTLSSIPLVGKFVEGLPNQNSVYEATLNKVFGDNWQQFKTPVTCALLGTGALATYQIVVKPLMSSSQAASQNMNDYYIEEEEPKRNPIKRRKRRKKKQNPVTETPAQAPLETFVAPQSVQPPKPKIDDDHIDAIVKKALSAAEAVSFKNPRKRKNAKISKVFKSKRKGKA